MFGANRRQVEIRDAEPGELVPLTVERACNPPADVFKAAHGEANLAVALWLAEWAADPVLLANVSERRRMIGKQQRVREFAAEQLRGMDAADQPRTVRDYVQQCAATGRQVRLDVAAAVVASAQTRAELKHLSHAAADKSRSVAADALNLVSGSLLASDIAHTASTYIVAARDSAAKVRQPDPAPLVTPAVASALRIAGWLTASRESFARELDAEFERGGFTTHSMYVMHRRNVAVAAGHPDRVDYAPKYLAQIGPAEPEAAATLVREAPADDRRQRLAPATFSTEPATR